MFLLKFAPALNSVIHYSADSLRTSHKDSSSATDSNTSGKARFQSAVKTGGNLQSFRKNVEQLRGANLKHPWNEIPNEIIAFIQVIC